MSRYGHLPSAPVGGRRLWYARSGNRLHSVQPSLSPRALRGASSMASCLSNDAFALLHCHRLHATPSDKVQKFVRGALCRVPKNACDRRIQKFLSGKSWTLLW